MRKDCIGKWSKCNKDCIKTYRIITPAKNGGIQCSYKSNDTKRCYNGEDVLLKRHLVLQQLWLLVLQLQQQWEDGKLYQININLIIQIKKTIKNVRVINIIQEQMIRLSLDEKNTSTSKPV